MIKKLKRKFTVLATVSVFLLVTALVTMMNTVNYSSVIKEADNRLDIIAGNDMNDDGPGGLRDFFSDPFSGFFPRLSGSNSHNDSRYFTVTVSEDGELLDADFSAVSNIDAKTATSYITGALKNENERAFAGTFRFLKIHGRFSQTLIFLDCSRYLQDIYRFAFISTVTGFFGCAAVCVVFFLVSGRIVAPIAESYEKQKRFITDAGHEIKTPLTVISANIDLLEADCGENECIDDIRKQIKRMSALTGDLIYLSKMDEENPGLKTVIFPVSDLVYEICSQFRALAVSRGIDYSVYVEPGLSMNGSPDSIRQLISVLADNAMKYSPDGGNVRVDFRQHKKNMVLTVFNTSANQVNNDSLTHIFDRFYRTDESRNSETGGHGIGLSVAEAITRAHGGRITAHTDTGYDFIITAVFPKQ